MTRELSLTPNQRKQLENVHLRNHGHAEALHRQVEKDRQALMELLFSPHADKSKALTLSRRISNEMGQLGDLRVETFFALRTILTPEQLSQMKRLHPPPPHHGFGGEEEGWGHPHSPKGEDSQSPTAPTSRSPAVR